MNCYNSEVTVTKIVAVLTKI